MTLGLFELVFLLVALGLLGTWLWALLEAIFRDPGGAGQVPWILAVLFLPVLGAVLYLLVRRPRRLRAQRS